VRTPQLPIDSLLPEIVEALRAAPGVVVEAPPGAGKTTRVPPALLDAGLAGQNEVWVLEPRRIAATLSARRVAEERGEALGVGVGYQVRFEDVSGPATRLRFVTEGVFTRRLLSDPLLSHVGCVVLDEFHERHLQADLALALARRLQLSERPDLKVVVMSATLEAAPVAEFLGHCPVLRSEGRRFDVAVEHLTRPDERPLEEQVAGAVRRLLDEKLNGDVLVFLPGAAEIRRAHAACAQLAAGENLLVLPLHGELPVAEQERAVQRQSQRKVILSTNVAETSVTIEGVVAVIDSGLARVAGHSPWSGLPTLAVARTSRASAEQRAGRAGRTRPGRCLRLYTAQDFAARPAHETPEISRLDLAEAALELHAAGVRDLRSFDWFEAPAAPALDAAETLLRRLGALDADGRVTKTGRRMLRFPLHPRLARVAVEAEQRGVGQAAAIVAALISERDVRAGRVTLGTGEREKPRVARSHSPSDLLELYDLFTEAAGANFSPRRLSELGLDAGAVRRVDRVSKQLRRIAGGEGKRGKWTELSNAEESELLISILAGYPDRVARRRASGNQREEAGAEVLLAGGGSARLAPESVVRRAEFMVAVDAGERSGGARPGGRRGAGEAVVRLASAIEPDWLLDLFMDQISESTEVVWDREALRAEVVRRLLYEGLVLDESRTGDGAGVETSAVLAEQALAAGVRAFADAEGLERFLARVEFLRRTFPETNFPELDEASVNAALAQLCEGLRSFAELREAARSGGFIEVLRRSLTQEQSRLLATMAPERVTLKRGRQARVHYERGRDPWVASRLQDFFGMREGPKVAGGRVPLVLQLLAPSQRPVQVTTDLAGFWSRHYPQVRRELSRRYPRHAWPADPLEQ
jgi:ATP-dependent helicase HrpB